MNRERWVYWWRAARCIYDPFLPFDFRERKQRPDELTTALYLCDRRLKSDDPRSRHLKDALERHHDDIPF